MQYLMLKVTNNVQFYKLTFFMKCADIIFNTHSDDLLPISVISQSSTTSNISWSLTDGVTAISYAISYANTNTTQCFFDSDDITGITENMYTLTGLQEGTEYSVTVTATLE